MPDDVIDELVGIAPGSPLDAVRAHRQVARTHAQASHDALFAPKDPGGVTAEERFALAVFLCGLHGEAETGAFYARGLAEAPAPLRAAIDAAIAGGRTIGPYGAFPVGPLSKEDSPGLEYRVDAELAAPLGRRLVAAFEHVHMLTFHPRDAAAPSLQAMLDAGWTTTDIVTLSQITSFLAFQIRAVAGLRVLKSVS